MDASLATVARPGTGCGFESPGLMLAAVGELTGAAAGGRLPAVSLVARPAAGTGAPTSFCTEPVGVAVVGGTNAFAAGCVADAAPGSDQSAVLAVSAPAVVPASARDGDGPVGAATGNAGSAAAGTTAAAASAALVVGSSSSCSSSSKENKGTGDSVVSIGFGGGAGGGGGGGGGTGRGPAPPWLEWSSASKPRRSMVSAQAAELACRWCCSA
mmetsp:Transcript_10634/g.22870  ORF Transcript_10634/g.22870 Transcript_10634/m.22870 type:complete len:213 (-) Transcript_10634:341-979(-)